MKFRIFLGVFLSTGDMGSDVYIVNQYVTNNEMAAAWGVVVMILLNLLFQLLVVYVQTHKRPKIMVREMLITVLCLKPARDVHRVLQKEKKEYETIEPFAEFLATKMGEVFFEALPGAILQVRANAPPMLLALVLHSAPQTSFLVARLSSGKPVSAAAFGSIAMSIMATSYAMQVSSERNGAPVCEPPSPFPSRFALTISFWS